MFKITTSIFILLNSISLYAGFIPFASRYDGAGSFYGAAYNSKFDSYELLVGAAGGDLSAYGALLTKHLSTNWEVSFGGLGFNGVSFLTTYQRNLASDDNAKYILNIEGSALAIGSKLWLLSDFFTFNLSAVKSTVKFDSYQDENEEEVDLAGANLFDVETLSLKAALDLNFYDNRRLPSKGLGLNTAVTQVSGRKGQSDQTILDYGLVALIPIYSHFSLQLRAQYSDAIVKTKSSYDTDQEIRNALAANCTSISDLTERSKCQNLENELVAYILKNNTNGTTSPLGGSSGLRSFREQRFKATHTALYITEFKTNLSSLFDILKSKDSRLELNLFYDQGHANDDKLELFDKLKYSKGAALQFLINLNAIKLQTASGSDNTNSWSLTFGKSF